MCYCDIILLSDVISSIGPKISDADTFTLGRGYTGHGGRHDARFDWSGV